MFSWRKNNPVVQMLEEYLQKAEECLDLMQEGFAAYATHGLGAEFDELVERTHMAESSCDDLRRQIEGAMYEKALIPESRGDILTLLEAVDKVLNRAESALFHIQMQFLKIPSEFLDKFRQLVRLNHTAFRHLSGALRSFLQEPAKIHGFLRNLDKEESASDHLEREMIRGFFAAPALAPDQRILLKELVLEFGRISNRCEDAGDRLHVIALKRLV